MRPPHLDSLCGDAAVLGQRQEGRQPREQTVVVQVLGRLLRVKQGIGGGGQPGLCGGTDRRGVGAEARAAQ